MAESNAGAATRRKAKETVETAKDAARDTLSAVQEGAGEAADAARQHAGKLGDQMREAAESLLRDQQERMADAVHGVADALRRTADTLEHEERGEVARYAGQAAQQIDRFSATVRSRNFGDLVSGAESFARRRPALFIAGAVAAGFIVGRALTDSSSAAPGEEGSMAGHGSAMAAGST